MPQPHSSEADRQADLFSPDRFQNHSVTLFSAPAEQLPNPPNTPNLPRTCRAHRPDQTKYRAETTYRAAPAA